jgi:hypothetical protein
MLRSIAPDDVGEPDQSKFDEGQRPEVAGSRRPENADGHSALAGYSHRIDLTADPAGGPSEVMCIRLLRWAGREAPELLEGLVTAYMTANRRKLLMACGDTAGTTDFERRARALGRARAMAVRRLASSMNWKNGISRKCCQRVEHCARRRPGWASTRPRFGANANATASKLAPCA